MVTAVGQMMGQRTLGPLELEGSVFIFHRAPVASANRALVQVVPCDDRHAFTPRPTTEKDQLMVKKDLNSYATECFAIINGAALKCNVEAVCRPPAEYG